MMWISPPPDDWLLRGPDEPNRPSGDDFQDGCTIAEGDLFIDGIGVYDSENGDMLSYIINGNHISVEKVQAALALLQIETGTWDRRLDDDTLDRMHSEAAEEHACAKADFDRDSRDGF